MIAVHQHFGFNHGNKSGFLTQRGIAGQRLGISLHTASTGYAWANRDYCPPLGKTSSHFSVFFKALAQSVQTLGNFLARMTSQVLRACIDLDTGNDSGIDNDFKKRSAVLLGLTDCLVKKNQPADALAEVGGGHDQLPIGAAGLLGLGNSELSESLIAGGVALVHCKQAFVICNQRLGCFD